MGAQAAISSAPAVLRVGHAIDALRGAGQTFQPMIWTLVGYWGLTLPLGWYLTFSCDFGLTGMWAALCIGLILVACAIGVIWVRWSRRLIQQGGQV